MNDFDKRLKAMAGAEVCPVPEGFESRIKEQLEELHKAKVRKDRPARWVLAAACLCVALMGTVAAAEIFWGVFSLGPSAHPENEHATLHAFLMQGTACFELDELLEEIAVLAEERDAAMAEARASDLDKYLETRHLYSERVAVAGFYSWEELSDFIGIPLAANPVLNHYPQGEAVVGPTRDADGNPLWLSAEAQYFADDTTIFVNAYLRLTQAGDESLYTPGFSTDESTTVDEEVYPMSDGSSGLIYNRVHESGASYIGVFIKDGICYWVTIHCQDGSNNKTESLLRDIMAAY